VILVEDHSAVKEARTRDAVQRKLLQVRSDARTLLLPAGWKTAFSQTTRTSLRLQTHSVNRDFFPLIDLFVALPHAVWDLVEAPSAIPMDWGIVAARVLS